MLAVYPDNAENPDNKKRYPITLEIVIFAFSSTL
jgi:hypothetical protein